MSKSLCQIFFLRNLRTVARTLVIMHKNDMVKMHKIMAEAIRTTVVPIRILIRTTVCRADNASYRHDRRADKNPYRHDRNMRFSSMLNYALFSILMVVFLNYVL